MKGSNQLNINLLYYPFGVTIKERTFAAQNIRYQFNGKEYDSETETSDFGARNLDGDLGIMESLDVLGGVYPNLTPYSAMAGNPINAVDVKGKLIIFINGFYGDGHSHDGESYLELQKYWDPILQANAARTLSDNYALFYSGSNDAFSPASERQSLGGAMGAQDALYIKELLDLQRKNDPDAKLNFVSHSQGGAYAVGMTNALANATYPPGHPKEGQKIFSKEDFGDSYFLAPHQSGDITAPKATHNKQFSHTNDWIARFDKMKELPKSSYKADYFNHFDNVVLDKFGSHLEKTFRDVFDKVGGKTPKAVGGKLGGKSTGKPNPNQRVSVPRFH